MSSVREEKKRIVAVLSALGIEEHEATSEAELILEFACGYDRLQQMASANVVVGAGCIEKIERVLSERRERVPIQYCVGYAWFMGTRFKVQKGVLIPRNDTETLVDVTTRSVREIGLERCITGEIGIGSGIIAVSLLKLLPSMKVVACDISEIALELSAENANDNNVNGRLTLHLGDWKAVLPSDLDVIVSNPPYISAVQKESLQPEVRFEPEAALFAGADGLDFYRDIARLGKHHLRDNKGLVFVEVGDGQAEDVVSEFSRNKWVNCRVHNDVNGLARVVSAVAQ